VGAIALVYNASGASKKIGAVVLTGPGNHLRRDEFVLLTAHLRSTRSSDDHGQHLCKTSDGRTIF